MARDPSRLPIPRPSYRPASAAGGDDLDALLDTILGEDPGPRRERADAARRAAAQQAQRPDQVTDELRAQIRAIALQVQALSEASANQAAHARQIQELRQAMRDVLLITHQQTKQQNSGFNAEVQLPSLQIKLVLAQAAHLLHQADKEAAVLSNWSMLFGGIFVGTLLSVLFSIGGPYTVYFWIYLAVSVFALLVSLVFAILTRQARLRVANARRAMDESTLTRTVPVGGG